MWPLPDPEIGRRLLFTLPGLLRIVIKQEICFVACGHDPLGFHSLYFVCVRAQACVELGE